jgi:hypothetical protein
MTDPVDYVGECAFCGTNPVEVRAYPADSNFPQVTDETNVLCLCCASTEAGAVHEYPEQYGRETAEILRAISIVGNIVLAALRRPAPPAFDPLERFRWVCGKCSTVNGNAIHSCLGCGAGRKP